MHSCPPCNCICVCDYGWTAQPFLQCVNRNQLVTQSVEIFCRQACQFLEQQHQQSLFQNIDIVHALVDIAAVVVAVVKAGSWVERRGGHHGCWTTTAPTTTATSHCSWGGNGCYVRSTGGHYEHNAPLANMFFFPIRFFILFSNSFICISYVVPLAFVRGVSSISIYNL
jgi:hypothetical protein